MKIMGYICFLAFAVCNLNAPIVSGATLMAAYLFYKLTEKS